MDIKIFMRKNPQTNILSGYFRLVESHRNRNNRICHRTIPSVGFLDDLTTDQLSLTQKTLTAKAASSSSVAFELPYSNDTTLNQYVDESFRRVCAEKRIDIEPNKQNVKKQADKDLQAIDVNSIKREDVREIGAEWLSYQTIRQLKPDEYSQQYGWDEPDVRLAITHLIGRAVYPSSALETTRWVQENSAVCEITGFGVAKITKDRLCKISHKQYSLKDEMEQYLSYRTNEPFDIEDKIVLYDLTNTCFEGEKRSSKLAQYDRSKGKRSDAKLVALALAVNVEGF